MYHNIIINVIPLHILCQRYNYFLTNKTYVRLTELSSCLCCIVLLSCIVMCCDIVLNFYVIVLYVLVVVVTSFISSGL
jgi:hypothetical protein